MILTVKILTGSPEAWVEHQVSAIEIWKPCEQCGEKFETSNLEKKFCSPRCRWNAANGQRALD